MSGNAGDAPYTAIFPASIAVASTTVALPAVQNSEDGSLTGFPMYAVSNDENLSFKNLCGALKLSLQKNGVSVSRIDVTTNAAVNGQYTIIMNGDAPTINLVSGGSNTASLVCATAQDISNGHDFYMYLPHNTYTSLTITITAEDGSVCTKSTNSNFIGLNIYRSQVSQISLGENALNFVPAEPTNVPAGAINGLFSISASKQIYFAKGNLQYVGTTGTWQFAEHQYDYLGTANANPTANSTIDLFGWGASGFDGKLPYMTSIDNTQYGFGYNRGISRTNYDWGVYNAIANGGNQADQWRLLNVSELRYLFISRPNAAAKRGIGTINGIPGLIILPDDWTMPAGLQFTPGASTVANRTWEINSYSYAEWALMEANGAVFLPAAGVREGELTVDVETVGCYWSNVSNNTDKAAATYFNNTKILSTNQYPKHQGSSVRLALVAE
ncbi:MAG: hypothetical protein IJ785_03795 [Bacteroidales bacterium]|nr:hypothetical protein [Bacteroidales bacterium]